VSWQGAAAPGAEGEAAFPQVARALALDVKEVLLKIVEGAPLTLEAVDPVEDDPPVLLILVVVVLEEDSPLLVVLVMAVVEEEGRLLELELELELELLFAALG